MSFLRSGKAVNSRPALEAGSHCRLTASAEGPNDFQVFAHFQSGSDKGVIARKITHLKAQFSRLIDVFGR
jgi:hypothetical protein